MKWRGRMANLEFLSWFAEDLAAIGALNRYIHCRLEMGNHFRWKRANQIRMIASKHRAMGEQVQHKTSRKHTESREAILMPKCR
jgi:hypothetical protein